MSQHCACPEMVRIFERSDSPREQEFDHHIRYFKAAREKRIYQRLVKTGKD
jgi:hypothetical protein